jgi:biopolymer transport protein ExbD
MKRLHSRHRRDHQLPEITLTPLIDTALTLLIIFMVAVPVMQNNIKVQLPQGEKREAESRKDDIVVTINKEGKLFINDKAITKETIISEIKKLMKQQDLVIFIRADESINWGSVNDLIQYLKSIGGITHVALATKKR